MMLAYDRTRITRDIDAVGVPQEDIDAEVQAMAADHRDLDPDWLNARVLPLLPRGIDGERLQVLGGPGLTVNVASPKWLLAMKARAARGRRDLDDIWVLCQIIAIRTTDEAWAICGDVWGAGMIREDVIDLVTSDLLSRGLRWPLLGTYFEFAPSNVGASQCLLPGLHQNLKQQSVAVLNRIIGNGPVQERLVEHVPFGGVHDHEIGFFAHIEVACAVFEIQCPCTGERAGEQQLCGVQGQGLRVGNGGVHANR